MGGAVLGYGLAHVYTTCRPLRERVPQAAAAVHSAVMPRFCCSVQRARLPFVLFCLYALPHSCVQGRLLTLSAAADGAAGGCGTSQCEHGEHDAHQKYAQCTV